MKYTNFLDDKEKMRDFVSITKDEFLASYSYLTEEEYDLTSKALKKENKLKKLYYVSWDEHYGVKVRAKNEEEAEEIALEKRVNDEIDDIGMNHNEEVTEIKE